MAMIEKDRRAVKYGTFSGVEKAITTLRDKLGSLHTGGWNDYKFRAAQVNAWRLRDLLDIYDAACQVRDVIERVWLGVINYEIPRVMVLKNRRGVQADVYLATMMWQYPVLRRTEEFLKLRREIKVIPPHRRFGPKFADLTREFVKQHYDAAADNKELVQVSLFSAGAIGSRTKAKIEAGKKYVTTTTTVVDNTFSLNFIDGIMRTRGKFGGDHNDLIAQVTSELAAYHDYMVMVVEGMCRVDASLYADEDGREEFASAVGNFTACALADISQIISAAERRISKLNQGIVHEVGATNPRFNTRTMTNSPAMAVEYALGVTLVSGDYPHFTKRLSALNLNNVWGGVRNGTISVGFPKLRLTALPRPHNNKVSENKSWELARKWAKLGLDEKMQGAFATINELGKHDPSLISE